MWRATGSWIGTSLQACNTWSGPRGCRKQFHQGLGVMWTLFLTATWYLCSTEAGTEGVEDVAAMQASRRNQLKQCFDQDFSVCPIARAAGANHWTLLVVVKDLSQVHYFDSLQDMSKNNLKIAQTLVKEFLPDLAFPDVRANAAFQKHGSAQCGVYVLHWMEQACRTYLLNESPCSIGWPQPKVWAARLCKLAQLLGAEKEHLEADKEKAAMKELKLLEQHHKKEALKKKSEAAEATAASLALDAAAALAKVPPTKPCRENLSAEAQAAIQLVEAKGLLVCSKCRFMSGCMQCHPDKALKYWLQKEFGHML